MRNFLKFLVSILICLTVGLIGSFFTLRSVSTWYTALSKPSFAPPNYLFAPVWTLLYIMIGASLYLVWRKGIKSKKSRDAIFLFGLQLALNGIWSPVFFGLKNILLALVILAFMWVYILKTILAFKKIDSLASYLLYPYLAWVTFAGVLNFSVWILNR